MKHRLINISIVIVSLVLALLLGEWVLREMRPLKTEVSDPILGTRSINRPGWDTNGWKNHAVLPHADIVAIGDSQTEGNNATVDESWPQQLAHIATTSVYQMAMGGYGPVQYGALFDDTVKLSPKTVIVGFYFGNDLQDAYRVAYTLDYWKALRDPSFVNPFATTTYVDYRTVLSTGLDPSSFAYRIYKARLWVRAHSVLYATLGNASRLLREYVGIAKTKQEKINDVAEFAETNPEMAYYEKTPGIETIINPSYRLDTVQLDYPTSGEGWRITQQQFLELKEKAKQRNIRLIFVVIPTKEGVYLEHWKRSTKTVPEVFAVYDAAETAFGSTTKAFCETNELECAFALPRMADALGKGEQLYGKTMDGHPIASGYRAIAETLAEYLNKQP